VGGDAAADDRDACHVRAVVLLPFFEKRLVD
jgi:hypothetical protein